MPAANEPFARRRRALVLAAVLAGHLLAIWLLLRPYAAALPPETAAMLLIDVPAPPAPPAGEAAGTAGESPPPATAARPTPAVAPNAAPPPVLEAIALPPATNGAPAPAGTGDGDGAAGGAGTGPGAGDGGNGAGGGAVIRARRIAGSIGRGDYPRAKTPAETGGSVTIRLEVGADGRVAGCTIIHPGRSPERDRLTCRLAMARFRYAPARDAQGRPVADVAGWRQDWWPEP